MAERSRASDALALAGLLLLGGALLEAFIQLLKDADAPAPVPEAPLAEAGGSTAGDVDCTPPWQQYAATDVAWRCLAMSFVFCGMALICDDYFTPALLKITDALELSEDVAGATFMAAGSSAPELFTSLIAVFAPKSACGAGTEGVGVGTIVGSAVFNILVIIGLSALLGVCRSGEELALDRRPLLRDTCFYTLAIALLYIFLLDGQVWWTEALAMFSTYCSYIIFMRFNEQVCYPDGRGEQALPGSEEEAHERSLEAAAAADLEAVGEVDKAQLTGGEDGASEGGEGAAAGGGGGWCGQALALLLLPWELAFRYTVPDCKQEQWAEWYMAGFGASIAWIGIMCYFMVVWAVDVAQMMQLTPTIMAFTVLAAGTSIPDAMESVIVAMQGKADMAVSNALGSNIFDILFGLSVPYMLVNLRNHLAGEDVPVTMCVKDLVVYLGCLVSTLAFTMGGFALKGFRLGSGLGVSLLLLYVAVLTGALLRDLQIVSLGDSCLE